MSVYKSWRTSSPHKYYREKMEVKNLAPTKIFDNLAIIGNNNVCCFLLETTDGLLMMDNMFPGDELYIEKCIQELGYDPAELKNILITHGHGDHYGNAVYFREKYDAKLWMSKIDEDFSQIPPPGKPDRWKPMSFKMDGYLKNGEIFKQGDAEIHCFHTPGHTPGCMSFIFDVYDCGRHHVCSLWGGTGKRRTLEENTQLLESCKSFAKIGLKFACDAAISTHPFVDNSTERLELIRNIVDGVPNPFVLGYEGYHRFEQMYLDFYQMGVDDMKKTDKAART